MLAVARRVAPAIDWREGDAGALPRLYVACGTEDHLFAGNTRFVEAASAKGLDLQVDFRPGEHEWGFWDTEIQKVLAWLPLESRTPA